MKLFIRVAVLTGWIVMPTWAFDGFIEQNGNTVYPIGLYHLPADEAGLVAWVSAGVNLVQAHRPEELDRVEAAGIRAWASPGLAAGRTEGLRKKIEALKDHPALAVWEGPDEFVWHFTAATHLESVGITDRDWLDQKPHAVAHAREQAALKMPKLLDGFALVRELDSRGLPIWMNEARLSDAGYVGEYLPAIDVVGCDYYPVRKMRRDPGVMGEVTDRWIEIADGKPVWMVLQGFSWSELDQDGDPAVPCYPTFQESRLMAWSSIAHGARGILYWGTHYAASEEFLKSIQAVTAELSTLQPFLIARDSAGVSVTPSAEDARRLDRGVRALFREVEGSHVLVLINEDRRRHDGVQISGLPTGITMQQLYGEDAIVIEDGTFKVDLDRFETRIYATDRKWASKRTEGRDF